MRRDLVQDIAVAAAVASAAVASAFWLLAPVYSTADTSSSPSTMTLRGMNGEWILPPLLLPLLLAGLPLPFRAQRKRAASALSAVLLLIFVLLTAASLGSTYLPALLFAGVGFMASPARGTRH